MAEMVNHPAHYNVGKIEVIDAIEDWKLGFNDGNAVKYVARARHKGKHLEDLLKARWYVDREIARVRALQEREAAEEAQRTRASKPRRRAARSAR